MRLPRTLLIAAFAAMTSIPALAEPGLVVIVRHAERGSEPAADPALTPEGVNRAAVLASALSSADITSVITTQYRRTRDTAGPLAKALGIEPLVVGHSDSVSAILAALNGPTMPNICDTSFDHIYVLAYANPKSSFLHLRYGEPGAAPKEGCL